MHFTRNKRLAFRFRQEAFIHKTLAERKKEDRLAKKSRIKGALASKSKADMDRMVDQSSRMIGNLTKGVKGGQEVITEDDEAEDWFGDE